MFDTPNLSFDIMIMNGLACSYYTVNGGWTLWSVWTSACSKPCNSGQISRHRTCTNPRPLYNGSNCPGNDTESKACNQHSCKGELIMSLRLKIKTCFKQMQLNCDNSL